MSEKRQSPMEPPLTPTDSNAKPSLVPMGLTIGLFCLALFLSLVGYGVRLLMGDSFSNVISHAIKIVPAFVIAIPAAFWLGAQIMNKVSETNIQSRNALTFGWLISSVAMLWLMGTYS